MPPPPPSMEQLLARYKTPQRRLDEKLSDELIPRIAKFINHAELGPVLGLSPQQMTDIEEEESTQNSKRIATLRRWREKYSFNATYTELIKALLECEKGEHAEEVCNLLSNPLEAPSGGGEKRCNGMALSLPNTTGADSLLTEGDTPDDKQPSSSAESQHQGTPTLTDCDVEPLDKSGEFRANIAQLENKFNTLVNSTADDLNTHKVDLVIVKRALFMPLLFDTNTDTQPSLDDHFTEIDKVKSIESLLMLCSCKKIWNVLNPGLLQKVVNQCGSNTVQEEMKRFMDELRQLRKGTRLKEFAAVVGMPSASVDGSIVTYKMSKEWEERTLEDVEILKRQHARNEIFHFVGIVKSSIILVWKIPCSHKEIFRQTPHSFFEEHEIKRVMLDGVTLFDSEGLSERDTTVNPPGTEEKRSRSPSATLGKNPLEISYPRKLHEEKEQDLLLAIKRVKGVEGKVPTPPVGEHYVQSRDIRYNIKQGSVAGNTSETMILVSVGDETPPGVAVKHRTRDATMAARAISKYGYLPSVVAGMHEELAADIMARASLSLKDGSTELVCLSIDTPGYQRSKEYHLKNIQEFFEQCKKPSAHLVYLGHSEKDTGNWCFKDGTISFQEIFDLYRRKCPEKCLCIMPDCCHSGQWINDCATVLDGLGIPPCGHRAREHGVLTKVFASCKPEQEAVEPCYSVEGIKIIEDGTLVYCTTTVNEAVTFIATDSTKLTCCRGPDEPCQSEKALENWKWKQAVHGGLLSKAFIVRGKDRGKPAWHFVLLSDLSEDYEKRFLEKVATGNIDIAEWGYIIQSGQGKDPPQSVKDRLSAWMYV